MPKPNASAAPDPAVGSSSHDARYSPDAGQDAFIDIPPAPATLAAMKNADPECSVGSGNDHAGTTAEANRRTVRNQGY